MSTLHRRRASDRRKANGLKRRVFLICALIVGALVAGVASIRDADAVGLHAANTAAAVGPSHVIALVLLVLLFFVTAGLVGVFWYHLVDSQAPKRRKH